MVCRDAEGHPGGVRYLYAGLFQIRCHCLAQIFAQQTGIVDDKSIKRLYIQRQNFERRGNAAAEQLAEHRVHGLVRNAEIQAELSHLMMVFPAVQMGADAFFGFNTAELPGIDLSSSRTSPDEKVQVTSTRKVKPHSSSRFWLSCRLPPTPASCSKYCRIALSACRASRRRKLRSFARR